MRPLLVVVGVIVFLMGLVWALQGAYVLPATFMRGDSWVAIGAVVAIAGFLVSAFGARSGKPSAKGTEPTN
ncbi:MAG: hypothetical protein A3K65_03275 [Euryarchaeota archaeon RBG_16_68_12]|nr:MAG: hypothetical protein A3K65_03275 [Euryarchaeota archaeon RBG_16_68_12]